MAALLAEGDSFRTPPASLKNKALLRRTESDRFELHELIRQFAALKLAENPDEEELAQVRHAFYYAGLLTDWEKALKCSRQVDALTEMVHEIANLRQAWQYMVACCDQDTTQNLLFPPSLFQSSLFSLSLFLEHALSQPGGDHSVGRVNESSQGWPRWQENCQAGLAF